MALVCFYLLLQSGGRIELNVGGYLRLNIDCIWAVELILDMRSTGLRLEERSIDLPIDDRDVILRLEERSTALILEDRSTSLTLEEL